MRVDLNCDAGEGFDDAAIFPYISAANIACGVHAGDAALMRRTLELAALHGVAAGAHPSLPDRANFGRVPMSITPEAARELVTGQVAVLLEHARAVGVTLRHVKPHGALYNMAAADAALAAAIARAVHEMDSALIVYGLAGSVLTAEAEHAGLRVAHEVFADRAYQPDGTLTPRSAAGALITDAELAAARAVRMVTHGVVAAVDGSEIPVHAGTICIHGDGPNAAAAARALRAALERAAIRIAAPGAP